MPQSEASGGRAHSTIRPEPHDEPRWEYRVFALRLRGLRARLEETTRALGREESRETYLIGPRPESSAKLRDGRLEVKKLLETRDGLELWDPVLRRDFPLSGRDWQAALAEHLGPGAVDLRRGARSPEALLSEIEARGDPGLEALPVLKQRERYAADGGLAELTTVELPGERLETAAVESADAARVAALVGELGLRRWRNISYPACLAWCAGQARAARAEA